jgi:hypothetical protein
VALILLILYGISLSMNIVNTIELVLFWLMYILSIATFVNIIITVYYYTIMKNKKGPRGPRGERGEKGERGDSGTCSIACRNDICEKGIKQKIVDVLNNLERRNGNRNSKLTINDLKNVFLKERIKTQCQSKEFQEMVPYKGPNTLIDYLKNIWGEMTTNLYNSGGLNYFKTIGAENDWDWLDKNPWNEFKKYDVYYWGLGKEYRPKIIDSNKCNYKDKSKLKSNNIHTEYPPNNYFTSNSNEALKSPKKRDSKYSILSYINLPSATNEHENGYISGFNKTTAGRVDLYDAYNFRVSDTIKAKYGSNFRNKAKKLKPLSYMIKASSKDNINCASINNKGHLSYKVCDPYDTKQIFKLIPNGKNSSKLREFYIKHPISGRYINNKNNNIRSISNAGKTTFKF